MQTTRSRASFAICGLWLLHVLGCHGQHAAPVKQAASPVEQSLDDVLRNGGAVVRLAGSDCVEWMATPGVDGEIGHLRTRSPDAEGFNHGVGFEYDGRKSEMTFWGPGKTPATMEVAEAHGSRPGWGLIGSASMCVFKLPVTRQLDGSYLVGDERWFLSSALCHEHSTNAGNTVASFGCGSQQRPDESDEGDDVPVEEPDDADSEE